MSNLKIAVAQISSMKGDINTNIKLHLKAIKKASELDVSYIVFPELSLTGYEPILSASLAFSKNDARLKPLLDAATQYKIIIGAGAPIMSDILPKIGLFIIHPSGKVETYEKMNLHSGEETYFTEGNLHHYIEIENVKIANAICADTNNTSHAISCSESGASAYIASVLITKNGYDSDTTVMKNYASKYNMLVAMANHNQPTGDLLPIGKSAIWSNIGQLAVATETQNALVVAEKAHNNWSGQVFEI